LFKDPAYPTGYDESTIQGVTKFSDNANQDAGVLGILGLAYQLSPRTVATISASYYHGLLNTAETTLVTYIRYNRSLFLSAGIAFVL